MVLVHTTKWAKPEQEEEEQKGVEGGGIAWKKAKKGEEGGERRKETLRMEMLGKEDTKKKRKGRDREPCNEREDVREGRGR